MTTENKKANWFVRVLIILLCLFIGGLVFLNFIWSVPKAQLSGGLLILVAFLTVLVLSEAFDNFSILKLISLSRTVKEKENKNQELKKENAELRNQIVNISTSINQKQVNSNLFVSEQLAKTFTVKQAEEPEKEEQRKEAEDATKEKQQIKPYKLIPKIENFVFPKFLQSEGLMQLPLLRNAKLVSHFQQVDPISEFSPIFDGYINTVDAEIFIELKVKRYTGTLRERLYIMLSKINYYRTIKKVNAYLYLVLISIPEDEKGDYGFLSISRSLEEFEPAISNGLLRIKTVIITQEEYDAINIAD